MTKLFITVLLGSSLITACATVEQPAKDVANAPVETLNINKVEIPDYLKNMDNPYSELAVTVTCADITSEVEMLTEYLGTDVDDPDFDPENESKAGMLARALIPYGGAVRFLSGATQHQKDSIAAARIGTARRAYLKSKGEQMGCAYPAAPHGA